MPGPPSRPSPARLLPAVVFLLAAALPSRAAGDGHPPDDGRVTVLGTGPLRGAKVVLRGKIEKVAALGMGVEMATLEVRETLWGTAPDRPRASVLSNETGFFSRTSPEGVFFLDPLEGGDRYQCRVIVDCGGREGPARLAALRRCLDVERRPRGERAAALRVICFESLAAPDAWTRQNAGLEIAHLAEILPGTFSAEDLADLRRAGIRERDPVLRPLYVRVVETLARAREEGRLAPPGEGAISLRGAPLLRRLREDPDPKVRRAAAAAVAKEGAAGTEALLESLGKDADAGVRAAAAEALASCGDPARAEPGLSSRAAAPGEAVEVRLASVESLGLLGCTVAVDGLEALARGDSAPVARASLFALARIRTPAAVAALRGVRADAAAAAGEGGAEVRDLVDFLLSADFLAQEEALRKIREARDR